MAPSALLSAQSLRVNEAGAPVIDALSLESTGDAVAVIGAPHALFDAAAGTRDVASGTLRVAGQVPRDAVRSGSVAGAPLDVAMPARWTVLRFVSENARLTARSSHEARVAIEAMELSKLANLKLGTAPPAVRRATVLASALASGAQVLLVEDFSPGLPDDVARSLAHVFLAAVRGRRWILFAGRLALASPLGIQTDEAFVFAGARLITSGAPAEIAARERTFSVRVSGAKATLYAERLRERGAGVQGSGAALTVTMPEQLSPRDLMIMAKESEVVLLELAPIAPALM